MERVINSACSKKTCPKVITVIKPEDQTCRIEMNWIRQIWLLFQALAAKTCPKGMKVTKPEDQNWNDFNLWQPKLVQKESKSPNQKIRIIALKWHESARFDYFFKLWQPKPVKKESNSPNQKIRFDVVWMGADALAPATLQTQSCKKEWKPTHQQPDLITFSSFGSLNLPKRNQSHHTQKARIDKISIFGSLNLSKRNQSHQTRRSELSHWSDMNQPDLITFSSFGRQNPSKRNQTHQTRRSDLTWFEWVLMLWRPQPFNRNPARRNESRRTSSQIWLLFPALAV